MADEKSTLTLEINSGNTLQVLKSVQEQVNKLKEAYVELSNGTRNSLGKANSALETHAAKVKESVSWTNPLNGVRTYHTAVSDMSADTLRVLAKEEVARKRMAAFTARINGRTYKGSAVDVGVTDEIIKRQAIAQAQEEAINEDRKRGNVVLREQAKIQRENMSLAGAHQAALAEDQRRSTASAKAQAKIQKEGMAYVQTYQAAQIEYSRRISAAKALEVKQYNQIVQAVQKLMALQGVDASAQTARRVLNQQAEQMRNLQYTTEIARSISAANAALGRDAISPARVQSLIVSKNPVLPSDTKAATAELLRMAENARLASAATATLSSRTRETAGSTSLFTSQSQKAMGATEAFTAAQARLHTALRGVAGTMGGLWLTYSRYVGTMAAAYGAASGVKKSISEGIDFDYQTRFIAAVGDNRSEDAFQGIQQGLYGIKDAPANVNELARSLRVLAQTGVETYQGISMLPTVMAAATLGEVSMKTAAEDLIGVMETFNMRSADSATFAANFEKTGDILAYVARETKADLHDVAASLANVTGVAEQYGIKIETVAAAITLLGKANITASKAGTYTRQMLENMYVPISDRAKAYMKALDFSMFNKDGSTKNSLEGIIELFQKLQKLNPKSQAEAINSIFNNRGARLARIVVTDLQGFIDTIKSAGDQSGRLKEGYEEVMKSTSSQLKLLSAEWDNLFTKAGKSNELLADPIQKLRDVVNDPATLTSLRSLIGGFVELTTWAIENARVIGGLVGVWAAFKASVVTFNVLQAGARYFGDLALAATHLGAALKPVPPTFSTLNSVATSATTGVALLTRGVGFLVKALPLIGTAVAVAELSIFAFRDRGVDAFRSLADHAESTASRIKKSFSGIDLEKLSHIELQARVEDAKAAIKSELSSLSTMREGIAKASGGKITTPEDMQKYLAYQEARSRVTAIGRIQTPEAQQDRKLVDENRDLYNIPGVVTGQIEEFNRTKQSVISLTDTYGNLVVRLEQVNVARSALARDKKSTGTDNLNVPDPREENTQSRLKEDTLSSKLKQENINLSTKQLEVDIRLARQDITSAAAAREKNTLAMNSAKARYDLINTALEEAKAQKNATLVTKFNNDLKEAAIEVDRQYAQNHKDYIASITTEKNALEDLRTSSARKIEDLQREADQYNYSTTKLKELNIELERKRALEDNKTKLERNQIEPTVYSENERVIEQEASAKQKLLEAQNSFSNGWSEAYQKYSDEAWNAANIAKNAFESVSSSMEDAIYNFTQTGKFSFKDMANSIIQDMARIASKQAASGLSGILSYGIKAVAGWAAGSSGTVSGTTVSSTSSWAQNPNWAHGGAFSSASLSKYSNGVYNSPQPFQFAHGAGVFGEAGPEAIMPLTRLPSGDLGVQATGGGGNGGGGGGNNITINTAVTVNSDGSAKSESQGASSGNATRISQMIEVSTLEVIQRELRPGGILYSM